MKFSDPYDFFGLALVQKEQKDFLRPCFFILGLRYWGPWTLWGPRYLDPALKQRKNPFGAPLFGASIFKFWGLTFCGPTLKQGRKNTFWSPRPRFLVPRFLNLIWGLAFSGGLGLFRALHWHTVWHK